MAEITFELDTDTLAMLDDAALWRGMTRAEYLTSAIRHSAGLDADLETKLQRGIDDANSGRLASQEDVEAWFDTRHRQAAAE